MCPNSITQQQQPADRPEGATGGSLAGLRVLDFTQVMAGPYASMMLADFGADVIKIEDPRAGDQTRSSWGKVEEGHDSRAFLALNRNKRSVCIDLKTTKGLAAVRELMRTADVVIQNWRPGVAARLGIGYEDVQRINPRIIYASISGFGATGPYADRPGYDLIAQAMTGVMSITGEAGGPPVKCGLPIADLGAGLFCLSGILAALHSRTLTGVGQHVETSLFESALALSVWESTEYWATGEIPQPLGSANRMSAPYQALKTRDGYVTIGANNDRFWQQLCLVLEAPELAADPRFATNNERMANRAQLVEQLEIRLAERDTDDWVAVLLGASIPAGPIRNYQQVLDHDEHVAARNMVRTVSHAVQGQVKVLGNPVRFSETPASIRTAAPLLGEHTDEVLAATELTYSVQTDA
ncbi:CaiB/BaiF CoA transferase family protein [Pseudarthrobacter sp. CCNWLW247]|uniref:CaiB/BaiF CoA transferase family protein n=1 Tax=unclassified Pseudarthrobacter TaxID=2647000 RepID=UPI003FD28D59